MLKDDNHQGHSQGKGDFNGLVELPRKFTYEFLHEFRKKILNGFPNEMLEEFAKEFSNEFSMTTADKFAKKSLIVAEVTFKAIFEGLPNGFFKDVPQKSSALF